VRKAMYGAGVLMMVLSAAATVAAGQVAPPPVPEIDGGFLSTVLGLLAGGVLMLRARFGRK